MFMTYLLKMTATLSDRIGPSLLASAHGIWDWVDFLWYATLYIPLFSHMVGNLINNANIRKQILKMPENLKPKE